MGITLQSAAINVDGVARPSGPPKVLVEAPIPTARWRFAEAAAPFLSDDGDLPLAVGTGAIASGHSAGTNLLSKVTAAGREGLRFGGQNWLSLPAANIGRLNVGASSGKVTVSCWFLNEDTNGGAIAGVWKEDNAAPSRSYCLFYDLPYYNGDEKVVGHVSKLGGATPGFPFSQDYSASLETIDRSGGVWEHYAFTYDGNQAISYLNGKGSTFAPGSFTDPDGTIHTEVKNPFLYPDGLNTAAADFTVGAVKLTAGMGNIIRGVLADLRVFNTALTPQQIQAVAAA